MYFKNLFTAAFFAFIATNFVGCEDKKPEQRVGAQFNAGKIEPGSEEEQKEDTSQPGNDDVLSADDIKDNPEAKNDDTKETATGNKDSAGTENSKNTTTNATTDSKTDTKTDVKEESAVKDTVSTEGPAQCQYVLWAECRKTTGKLSCDTEHNCTESSIFNEQQSKEMASATCKDVASYETCRSKDATNDETRVLCDKQFTCTVADIKLKQIATEKKVETTAGGVDTVVVASDAGAAKVTPVQPALDAKPKNNTGCDTKKRDICLANKGGFGCYTDLKCEPLVAELSGLCDPYGLKLCVDKGIGQDCYTTYKCQSLDKPLAALPMINLDQACYNKVSKVCKDGGGGITCTDKTLDRYKSCRL